MVEFNRLSPEPVITLVTLTPRALLRISTLFTWAINDSTRFRRKVAGIPRNCDYDTWKVEPAFSGFSMAHRVLRRGATVRAETMLTSKAMWV